MLPIIDGDRLHLVDQVLGGVNVGHFQSSPYFIEVLMTCLQFLLAKLRQSAKLSILLDPLFEVYFDDVYLDCFTDTRELFLDHREYCSKPVNSIVDFRNRYL